MVAKNVSSFQLILKMDKAVKNAKMGKNISIVV